jgi:hypothetical protein
MSDSILFPPIPIVGALITLAGDEGEVIGAGRNPSLHIIGMPWITAWTLPFILKVAN